MFDLGTIYRGVLVFSVVAFSVAFGIIIASYVVTTGMSLLEVKLSPAVQKTAVVIYALSAGYLGLTWALMHM
ncbi:MAG: hypothetical protein DDT18_01898 [Actinobacteria bacterium]|nr:hypothetical protein [Actinomycetota bacterium]